MQKNIGPLDKKLRIAAGIVILGLGLAFKNWLGLIGLVPLATAFLGFCPAYCPFKISTAKKEG